jgi:hypothetical protein
MLKLTALVPGAFLAACLSISCNEKKADAPPVAAKSGGGVATLAQLVAIKLPPPPKTAATGGWQPAFANEDGDRQEVWKDGSKFGLSVRLMDCRSKKAAEVKGQPEISQGAHAACHQPGKDQLKGYALRKPKDTERTLLVGNIAVRATMDSDSKELTPAEIEEYLGKLDLSALGKL